MRDPLLTLGCCDPVERVEVIKKHDPHRQRTIELFRLWNTHHGEAPVKAVDLAEPVVKELDPQNRGRQYVTARLGSLAGTRAGGFVLTRQEAPGKWGASTYALHPTAAQDGDGVEHRDHREHPALMPPMPPMPGDLSASDLAEEEQGSWTG